MSKFYLTRTANLDLLNIEKYSEKEWGRAQTAQYMKDIFGAFGKIAQNPELGQLRFQRSAPFLMAPVRQHYAIYKAVQQGIIIATILHGRRNIEAVIRDMAPVLAQEITEIEGKI